MADRPYNIRPSSILERSYASGGHNSRRIIPEARGEDNRHTYRGSHRADSMHRADSTHRADDQRTAAENRSSRVGRHHAEPTEEHTRW